ncbi:MAG: class I SAM-dependent RNA methyltransferase [Gammaproteobacteria bacterium]|nr:MAG: class I SAM-dependent RNA methyltransferase [Gammaproteobacteria bacterium]
MKRKKNHPKPPSRFHAKSHARPSGKPRSGLLNRQVEFTIEQMDALGQGVAHIDGKPCFIAKTLPGEKGKATITRASKGVLFARMDEREVAADNRIEPQCPHFDSCPGCHFLHTDYESELGYKRDALSGHLKRLNLPLPEIEVLAAKERLGYRNRIQLHYRHKYIGMIDPVADSVLEIPQCQVIDEQLRPTFDGLYQQREWTSDHSGQGHCELYLTPQGVSVEWDRPYAHGGFTQVNRAMNDVLRKAVLDQVGDMALHSLLDLFSGEGNLSELLAAENTDMARVMVDYAPERVKQEELSFIHLDLFADTALRTFRARCKQEQFDVLLVDPPRKGFPALSQWVAAYKPKKMIYVSCNAATMVRDLQQLGDAARIEHVSMIDLFPATHHYETLVTVTFP